MKKNHQKNKQKTKTCHNCDNCVYIGEGDYICDKGNYPFICMEDHCPNEFFCACKTPKTFMEAQKITEEKN